MNNDSDAYERILTTKGISLQALGLGDVALGRAETLSAIQVLKVQSVAILGGDVYVERNGKIEVGYANWHVDRDAGENSAEFAARSCLRAEQYVENFPHRAGEIPLFVLVVSSA